MKLFPFLLLCISLSGFAQENDYKNEIGVNLGPFLIPLYVEDAYPVKLEASFVHHLSNKYNFRLKASVVNLSPDKGIEPSTIPFRLDTTLFNPDEMYRLEYGQHEVSAYRLYFSFERNISLGALDIYGGIGVVPGVIKNASYVYEVQYRYDSTYAIYDRSQSGFKGDDFFPSFSLGVAPYLGLKVPVGERFLINFQTGIQYDYHFTTFRAVGTPDVYKRFHSEFYLWPLMGELGVYLRI